MRNSLLTTSCGRRRFWVGETIRKQMKLSWSNPDKETSINVLLWTGRIFKNRRSNLPTGSSRSVDIYEEAPRLHSAMNSHHPAAQRR